VRAPWRASAPRWTSTSTSAPLSPVTARLRHVSSERRAESAPAEAPAPATTASRAEAAPSLGTLARHSFTYSLVPILQRVISLVMLYFYAFWLTEAQYGLADLGDLLLGALVQLLGFNVVGAMMRHYFDHTEEADRAAVVSSSTIAVAILAWVVIAPLALVSDSLAELVLAAGQDEVRPYDVRAVMLLVLLTAPFQLLTQCGYTYLQIHKRSGLFTTISLVKFTIELALRIYLVGVAGYGVIGFFVPVLIGEAVTTLLLTGWVLWHTKLRFRWNVLSPILRYTLPLIPVGLLQLGLHYGDRKLLQMFSPEADSLHEVGIYGMGYRLGFIVTMAMLGPFVQIFHPWIYGVKDRAMQSENLARVSTYGIAAMTFASLFVVAFAKQALDLMPDDKEFGLAYRVVPYIATAYVLWSVYHLSQIPLYIAKRNGPLVWINLIAVLANVALNAELVPSYGFVGAGLATLGTFGLLAALGLYVGARASDMHFQYGRILGTLSAMVGTSLLAMLVDENVATTAWSGVALAVAAKLAGVSLFSAWLWFGVITADERAQFATWLRSKLPAR
jgi:O-antigen/teichoic acid export membrane protein